jgi:hypothetical protein
MRSGVASCRGAVVLALVLAVGACADTRPGSRSSRRAATPIPRPAPIATVSPSGPVELVEASCSDTLESGALRCAEGAAVRRGDTLAIMLHDGRTVQRLDNRLVGDAFVSFAYAGRLGGSSGTPVFHMLEVQGPGSWAVELINARTGDSVVVADRPLLSPDGARFALARMDLETCEGGNVLEVWRITGDLPMREFTLEPYDCTQNKGWGASDLEWISRDTLGLLRNTHWKAAQRARADYDTTSARLTRGASGWVLDRRSR